MLNNQIIVTDDSLRACASRKGDNGVIDAVKLTDDQWAELCGRNVNSAQARLVKCAFCWNDHGATQWMKTFNRLGSRVVSHQRGEALDHPYQSVETPEHRAYVNRALVIGDAEGYTTKREAWAPNKKTRADALITGTVSVAYEHQHSPFSANGRYSAPERTRFANAAGRTVMWHATSDTVRGQVPILRTDGHLPPPVIENPNFRHEFRGGIYRIEVYTCDVRWGHECPDRKFSGCGKAHARGQVMAADLDDVLRGAPVGAYVPVTDAKVIRAPKFFWTDQRSYEQYLLYVAEPEAPPLMAGRATAAPKTRHGIAAGHSQAKERELAALRGRPSTAARPVAPLAQPQRSGRCDTGSPLCGQPARFYAAGWRCDDHKPSSNWFRN